MWAFKWTDARKPSNPLSHEEKPIRDFSSSYRAAKQGRKENMDNLAKEYTEEMTLNELKQFIEEMDDRTIANIIIMPRDRKGVHTDDGEHEI